jgi:hypothetical protein
MAARRQLEIGHGTAPDDPPPLRPAKERLVHVAGVVQPRRTQTRAAHPAKDPVDRRLVHVDHPPPADLTREPLLVHTPIGLHRRRIATLLLQKMLGQEPLNGLVDGDIAIGLRLGQARRLDLGGELRQCTGGLEGAVRPHGAVHPTHGLIVKTTGAHRQLPHARPNLDLRAGAPGGTALSRPIAG